MLAEVGWVVVLWIIWTALFILTMTLIRFTMFGQQEVVAEQEAEITAAQTGQSVEDVLAAAVASGSAPAPEPPTESALRWALRWPPRREAQPPVSAS